MADPSAAASAAGAARWQLCLAVHTMEVATAKVPFSMILLMDHVRTKRGLQEDVMRCRMVVPSDGLISFSLWDTTDPDALKAWLDDNLGSDCISQVSEVQEEFTLGVALELARARGADRVAGGGRKTLDALNQGLSTAQTRLQEFDSRTGAISAAKEATAAAVNKVSGAVHKAAENEHVQTALAGASVAVASAWSKVSDSFGWAGRKLEATAREQGLIGDGGGSGGIGGGGGIGSGGIGSGGVYGGSGLGSAPPAAPSAAAPAAAAPAPAAAVAAAAPAKAADPFDGLDGLGSAPPPPLQQ